MVQPQTHYRSQRTQKRQARRSKPQRIPRHRHQIRWQHRRLRHRIRCLKGSINIEAGRKLTLYAVEELNYDKLDSHKRRRFLGITYGKAHDTVTQDMKTALPSRVVAESANLQSGWDTKLQGTQFETTLGGAIIRAGVDEQARADAKIILEGIKAASTRNREQQQIHSWRKQAGRCSNIETLQLPSFSCPVAPVLSAPGGYIVDIRQGNLKTQIETLAKQPEYAYVKQLQVAKIINWNQVQLAYDKWDYKQEGLTEAGAAIIALAVTLVTLRRRNRSRIGIKRCGRRRNRCSICLFGQPGFRSVHQQ